MKRRIEPVQRLSEWESYQKRLLSLFRYLCVREMKRASLVGRPIQERQRKPDVHAYGWLIGVTLHRQFRYNYGLYFMWRSKWIKMKTPDFQRRFAERKRRVRA